MYHQGYNSLIVIDDMSDHLPCVLQIPSLFAQRSYISVKREINVKILESITKELHKIDWSFTDSEDFNTACTKFCDIISEQLEKNCPIKSTVNVNNTNGKLPWISESLLKCINKKNKFYNTHMCKKTTKSKIEYMEYKNLLQKIIRRSRIDYFTNFIKNVKGNSKTIWNAINICLKSGRDKTSLPNTFKIEGKDTTDKKLIANAFGQYYSKIGTNLASKISSNGDYLKFMNKSCDTTFFLAPTDPYEVNKIISDLKNKTSYGLDGVSNVILKNLSTSLLAPLTILINRSLQTGIFPDCFKTALIKPLYKSKENDLIENYRPISLLSVISKIFEKVMTILLFRRQ